MATVSADPRFGLARKLVSSSEEGGGPAAAIEIFEPLLRASVEAHGEESLDAALCRYEYGNALFRLVVRRRGRNNGKQAEGGEDDKKPAAKKESQREITAAAALKRSAAGDDSNASSNKRVKTEGDDSVDNKEGLKEGDAIHSKDDVQPTSSANAKIGAENDMDDANIDLALEMLNESWEIFVRNNQSNQQKNNQQWTLGQIPRVLETIGELYLHRGEYANAVDSNFKALEYRHKAWDRLKQTHAQNDSGEETERLTLEDLHCQRKLVETYALVTETLLACHKGDDVVCYLGDANEEGGASAVTAKGSKGPEQTQGRKLVNANNRLYCAQSHYEQARIGFEEVLGRYAKMAAAKMELGDEKEDIKNLVLMLVDIGNMIQDQKL
mmetsp:Transcript_22053/g.47964  ORF Transcript_22053/g.47964 Transcript_22053/m.47964 type:complete len:383 (-) Transcript_22053:110-1258(-)|eukprot:CAMPEP_0172316602 /NCGR_PEP_ID=MMETSP1058-20130122/28792_1 /TAXON_ID=83371 /ORGANISM="Detonula confervacea, Strain CCMP 353" /LENGTH=382 /DNA_ID=CAMNT_0013030943 /DNA_START=101 /DNA_END=1249 /DNA_ORIENTATION=-